MEREKELYQPYVGKFPANPFVRYSKTYGGADDEKAIGVVALPDDDLIVLKRVNGQDGHSFCYELTRLAPSCGKPPLVQGVWRLER